MAPMPPTVRAAFDKELEDAWATDDLDARWRSLERAHILSQPWALPHTRAHWHMLRLAVRCHDSREIIGQLVRLLVAGPGSSIGRVPVGNPGRATVGLMVTVPIPEDLARVLADGVARSSR